MGHYAGAHPRLGGDRPQHDGFIIVTPEYNLSIPAALTNATDHVAAEWNDKAVGFVGYDSAGGTRAVEHLRGIAAAELQMADVCAKVALTLATDFEQCRTSHPGPTPTAAPAAVRPGDGRSRRTTIEASMSSTLTTPATSTTRTLSRITRKIDLGPDEQVDAKALVFVPGMRP